MAKHKYIKTPEDFETLFKEWVNYVESNPIKKQVFVGKDGRHDYELIPRPYTLEGFLNFAEENICNVHQYFENREGRYSEYVDICTRIKRVIRQNQIENGLAGLYNPSITQRLNNLTEKTDVTSNGENINEIKISIIRPDAKELE
jgi:hypothetical protein